MAKTQQEKITGSNLTRSDTAPTSSSQANNEENFVRRSGRVRISTNKNIVLEDTRIKTSALENPTSTSSLSNTPTNKNIQERPSSVQKYLGYDLPSTVSIDGLNVASRKLESRRYPQKSNGGNRQVIDSDDTNYGDLIHANKEKDGKSCVSEWQRGVSHFEEV